MFIPRIILHLLFLALPLAVWGQSATLNSAAGTGGGAEQTKSAPKLEHFDPT
ncbi:MAG: hypothetical protein QOF94_727, partial [Acidobacteriaceae bacterium]